MRSRYAAENPSEIISVISAACARLPASRRSEQRRAAKIRRDITPLAQTLARCAYYARLRAEGHVQQKQKAKPDRAWPLSTEQAARLANVRSLLSIPWRRGRRPSCSP